jgi:hypothetical protein
MTKEEIAFHKLKAAILQAMKRNQAGVRVTMENFIAEAELMKLDQPDCYEMAGQLYVKLQA